MKRLMKLLARLYPAAWRNRYGAEFEALLEDGTPRIRDAFNVLSGALKMQMTAWSLTRITLASCVAGTLVAIAISFAIPPRYVAKTIVIVAENHMAGHFDKVGRNEMAAEISNTKDTVLNADFLIPIIQEQNLYPHDRDRMPLDAVLNKMRRNIAITPTQKGDLTGFALNFAYPDPQVAQRVDKELFSRLISSHFHAGIEAASVGRLQLPLVFIVNQETSLPQKPTFPKRSLFGIFGLLIGFTAALMLAATLRLLRKTTVTNA